MQACTRWPIVSGTRAAPAAAGAGGAATAGPAIASVADTIGQRVQACIACHGREGSAASSTYFPRLAGKPARYLYNQLLSFRDGRRFNSDMTHMVAFLSDDYLREIAEYFAALDYPYPAPSAGGASADQLALGRRLALEGDPGREIPACIACHGAALTGVQPGIPGLLGLPRLYLASQLGAWVTDARHALPPDCMAKVGKRLNNADINAVASWLAAQPLPADPKAVHDVPGPLALACSAMQR
ncbi:MAG: c-type cytochrome [Comamonadaceae bacterium]|nr:MAG: c-type cytochrome [Comamonadaceae bacterium]